MLRDFFFDAETFEHVPDIDARNRPRPLRLVTIRHYTLEEAQESLETIPRIGLEREGWDVPCDLRDPFGGNEAA